MLLLEVFVDNFFEWNKHLMIWYEILKNYHICDNTSAINLFKNPIQDLD